MKDFAFQFLKTTSDLAFDNEIKTTTENRLSNDDCRLRMSFVICIKHNDLPKTLRLALIFVYHPGALIKSTPGQLLSLVKWPRYHYSLFDRSHKM